MESTDRQPVALVPTVRVVACLHPLRHEPRIDRYIPAGGTVADCLRIIDAPPRIWGYAAQIDDEPIAESDQFTVRPPAGSTVIRPSSMVEPPVRLTAG